MKKHTISIGIPAFNEEKNIGHLLVSILSQKTRSIELAEVIIVSDGSTDNTVGVVRKISDKRVKLIVKKKRTGLNATQNLIIKKATSDVFVMLNADIILVGDSFLENITRPLLKNKKVGIVAVDSVSARPQTFVERVLGNSHFYKVALYKRIKKGNNIYMCYGVARAFNRELYENMRWPRNCPEDSYSYLLAQKKGYHFHFESSAKVIFRSPSTFSDHLKQSSRFKSGRKVLEKMFGKDIVRREFYISPFLACLVFIRLFPRRSLSLSSYVLFQIAARFMSRYKAQFKDKHEVASSTKGLVSYSLVVYSLVEKL